MSFNLIDAVALAYVAYGVRLGWKRGLSSELPRLVMILLFVLSGCTLSHWLRVIFGKINVLTGHIAGGFGFVGMFAAGMFLARLFRNRFTSWLSGKLPVEAIQKRGGAIIGGLRTLVIACTLIVFIGLMRFGIVSEPFAQGSFIGRNLIHLVVPVYEKIAGQPTGK